MFVPLASQDLADLSGAVEWEAARQGRLAGRWRDPLFRRMHRNRSEAAHALWWRVRAWWELLSSREGTGG